MLIMNYTNLHHALHRFREFILLLNSPAPSLLKLLLLKPLFSGPIIYYIRFILVLVRVQINHDYAGCKSKYTAPASQ